MGTIGPGRLAERYQGTQSMFKTHWDVFELLKALILGVLVAALVL
jgi:hypothetical protein